MLVVPVGSLEQHGPHLPLDTDTRIAAALARLLAESLGDEPLGVPVMVAPPVAYGASGEHQDFAGTVSIGTAALETLLIELVRSARRSFGAVLLVSTHGGNAEAVGGALRRARAEGDLVAAGPSSPGDPSRTGSPRPSRPGSFGTGRRDAHAGRTETSIMLALDPGAVGRELVPGRREPIARLLPGLRARGVRALSPNGVLGDPRGASAEEGHRLLAEAVLALRAVAVALGARIGGGPERRRGVAPPNAR
jgi:creatinine amidohydrolase